MRCDDLRCRSCGGGYAISRDEIEGFTERSQETTWHAAQEVLRGSGAIIYTDPGRGLIEADVQNSRVSIEVLQVSPKTVRLHVKARKFWRMFPDMSRAQEIFSRIINELK